MLKSYIGSRGILFYTAILLVLPLLLCSLVLYCLKFNRMDFYEYIGIFVIISSIFISPWILIGIYGDISKADLSMQIVASMVLFIFLLVIAMIEILPNDIFETLLAPLLREKEKWDLLNRPVYQVARFICMIFSFPYFASFGISNIILKGRKLLKVNKEVL